jgi:hypothetical protein
LSLALLLWPAVPVGVILFCGRFSTDVQDQLCLTL